jgi:hypothetical protein
VVNLIHGTDCIIQSEEIALAEEVTCWQGEVYCTGAMLGKSMNLILY